MRKKRKKCKTGTEPILQGPTEHLDLPLVCFLLKIYFFIQYILITASPPPTLPKLGFLIKILTQSSTYKYYTFLVSFSILFQKSVAEGH